MNEQAEVRSPVRAAATSSGPQPPPDTYSGEAVLRSDPRRYSYCHTHKLRRRCPACDISRQPEGVFAALEVPVGTSECLREAARYFDSMGTESAVEFVQWVCCDLREVA